ncbi:hypothetical protein Pcinc_021029 [Petrolisthes cinctipes]|uniref:Uncharacterized protein n=1 Tax=Petrolisthes cinctipes TaxID=88211 RepID=A0AAE1FII2_PETCI|nr:hypothetical protein Pcinc_021029 [Petrolisthes cinctipes]
MNATKPVSNRQSPSQGPDSQTHRIANSKGVAKCTDINFSSPAAKYCTMFCRNAMNFHINIVLSTTSNPFLPNGIDEIERVTRKQNKSRVWYQQQAGRVTASNLQKVVHTSASNPAPSLIKTICYNKANRFS